MTQNIPYSYFDLGKLTTLANDLLALTNSAYGDTPTLQPTLAALMTALEGAKASLGTDSTESLTASVQEADDLRDDSFRSLRDHIRAGLRRHANPAYQQACGRLHAIVQRHGSRLYYQPYANESALLASLFQELAEAQSVTDLATIHATDWLAELQNDETRFLKVWKARNDQKVQADTVDATHEAKRKLKEQTEALLVVLSGFHLGNLLPDSDGFMARINQTIERAAQQARQHQARRHTAEGDDVQPPTEDGGSSDSPPPGQ